MKSQCKLALSAGLASLVIPMSADAEVIVAGWDTFTAEPESSSPATILDADTAATMSGGGTGGGWNDWNGGVQGASSDGTFGNLSNSVGSASTFVGTGSNQNTNLSLNRSVKPGFLTFSLVNNSGVDRDFLGFYFDGAHRFAQSAPNWDLTFSGAISGSAASGTLGNADMMDLTAAQRDWGIDLTGLTDSTWEAGSTATFTLTFSGGPATNLTGGGHETIVDNIAITASEVPEPGSLALLGLGGLLIARRRR